MNLSVPSGFSPAVPAILPVSITPDSPGSYDVTVTILDSTGVPVQMFTHFGTVFSASPRTFLEAWTPLVRDRYQVQVKLYPAHSTVASATATAGPVIVNGSVTPVPTPTPTPTPAPTPGPPSGYAKLAFADYFGGPALDRTKWNPFMGDMRFGRWDDHGALPDPYSAVSNHGSNKAEYGDPALVTVNNGLTLGTRRDSSKAGYSWAAGYVSSKTAFFTRGLLLVKGRLCNTLQGGWPAIWMLDDQGSGEIDLNDGGAYNGQGQAAANRLIYSKMFLAGKPTTIHDTGIDLTAGVHEYGLAYDPSQSLEFRFDGAVYWRLTQGIPSAAYQLLLTQQIGQNTSGWHSQADGSTPSPITPAFTITSVELWQ